ncbi:MAG: type II toxin-antitoxin system RelE/ParE family toxin [Bacteroidota bacterium]
MNIIQTRSFIRVVKKLHKNQKADLDDAIKAIIDDPYIGQEKKGDLSDIRVYKFKMVKQLTLLAYNYKEQTITLTLLALGSH